MKKHTSMYSKKGERITFRAGRFSPEKISRMKGKSLPSVIEKRLSDFDERFNWGIASLVNSNKKDPLSIRDLNTIKSFLQSSMQEAYYAGMEAEAIKCHEHTKQAYKQSLNQGAVKRIEVEKAKIDECRCLPSSQYCPHFETEKILDKTIKILQSL